MANSSPVVIASDQSTIPVSAASLPLPTGAATAANQATEIASLASIDAGIPAALGQTLMAASMPVTIASNQTAVPISAASLPLPTGAATEATLATRLAEATFTARINTLGQKTMAASTPVTLASDQSTLPISAASLPLPTGAATAALQTTGNASLASIDAGIPTALGQTTMANSMPVVFATDQTPILVTASSNSDFTFGDVTLTAIALAVVRRTAYTEQTSNAQRSIVSASASDAAAGTGARTVRITYYTATFTGPFTETLTLNGTTPVNTVASNICYIESMEVLTVGSGLTNAGIISLKAATAGGGVTIGTIAASNGQTFWAHHYVATGKVCNVTGISVSHNGTTVGSGGDFILRAQTLGVTDAADIQVSDFVRLYGQASTFARDYTSAIKIPGPSRIAMWVTPETASSTIYRAAIDFFEP
jgi:hypothetical protein